VEDETCPSSNFSFAGSTIELAGCCDESGVCGMSTANIPSFPGITIPVMCLAPGEDLGFGQPPPTDAGGQPCDYSGTSTLDAGGVPTVDASAGDAG
jgi:hypothetical protein